MFEIQYYSFDTVKGGNWYTVVYGNKLDNALDNFNIYTQKMPEHLRGFHRDSVLKVYDRNKQEFIATL